MNARFWKWYFAIISPFPEDISLISYFWWDHPTEFIIKNQIFLSLFSFFSSPPLLIFLLVTQNSLHLGYIVFIHFHSHSTQSSPTDFSSSFFSFSRHLAVFDLTFSDQNLTQLALLASLTNYTFGAILCDNFVENKSCYQPLFNPYAN